LTYYVSVIYCYQEVRKMTIRNKEINKTNKGYKLVCNNRTYYIYEKCNSENDALETWSAWHSGAKFLNVVQVA